MAYPLVLSQSEILTCIRAVILGALPAGIEVVLSQLNRVPEPEGADFVVLTPILRTRLGMNTDIYADCAFTGSIIGTVLTVTEVSVGAIQNNAPVIGAAAGTVIAGQISGPAGGIGEYAVSPSQTLASGPLSAGIRGLMQPTQITVQADVHGPNSADNVQILSTLFRSSYAAELFEQQSWAGVGNFIIGQSQIGFADVTPLYTADPRESPFSNAENQIEMMWSVDLVLQANQVVNVPQQFAAAAAVTVLPPVDASMG